MAVGDVLGVEESLGHQARFISIEAIGGDVIIRFNTVQKMFKNHEALGNKPFLGRDAAFWTSAVLAGEVEIAKPDITIKNGEAQNWRDGEIAVQDIKIVALAPLTRITCS